MSVQVCIAMIAWQTPVMTVYMSVFLVARLTYVVSVQTCVALEAMAGLHVGTWAVAQQLHQMRHAWREVSLVVLCQTSTQAMLTLPFCKVCSIQCVCLSVCGCVSCIRL